MDEYETTIARLAHPGLNADPPELDAVPEQFVEENQLWGLPADHSVYVDDRGSLDRQRAKFEELDFLLDQLTNQYSLVNKFPTLPKRNRELEFFVTYGLKFNVVQRSPELIEIHLREE